MTTIIKLFTKHFFIIIVLLILSPVFSSDVFGQDVDKCNYEVSPNSANLFKTWSNLNFASDETASEAVLDARCSKARGIFGLEAGSVANGDSSTGGVFWFMEGSTYDFKVGFNIGKSASVDADFSNIGDIIRDSNDFGQFVFAGKKIWGQEFGDVRLNVGTLLDVSYTQFDFEGEQDSRPDDGGLLALRAGIFLPSEEFSFDEGGTLSGTVLLSIALEHRRMVEDIANNQADIASVLRGNDTSFSGLSTQVDVSMSNNQRYFIKLSKFNDAEGISGLDGTQITVGLKIDGILGSDQ